MTSHYNWLNKWFQTILENIEVPDPVFWMGLITAYGDKCYSYKSEWNKHGIPFPHGVALYLLTHIPPWEEQVRQTKDGWVSAEKWD